MSGLVRRARVCRGTHPLMRWEVRFDPPVQPWHYHGFYRWEDAIEFALGVLRGEPIWTDQLRGDTARRFG